MADLEDKSQDFGVRIIFLFCLKTECELFS